MYFCIFDKEQVISILARVNSIHYPQREFRRKYIKVSSMKPTTMSPHRNDLATETLASNKKFEEKLVINIEPELAATSQPFVVGTDLTLKDFVLPRGLRFHTSFDEFADEDSGSFPVIDLQRNFATTYGEITTSGQLARAAATWGFFKVINHGVPPEIFEKNQANARSIFGKEVGEKRGIVGQAGTYLGYHEGTSLGAHSSWHENVGFPRSPEKLREMVRQVWPHDPVRAEELRRDIMEYLDYMEGLSMHLLELLEEGLGLQPKSISQHYKLSCQESSSMLKFNHYPACQRPDLAQGFPPHTDASTMAILHQDVGGLQVLKDGEWLSIRPEPGSLIVNIGDTLQAWSNGKYQSVQHRVALNPTSARISHVYFLNPPDNTLIKPLPELIDASHPAKYRPFTWVEYRSFIASNLKAGEPAKRLDNVALVG